MVYDFGGSYKNRGVHSITVIMNLVTEKPKLVVSCFINRNSFLLAKEMYQLIC